MAHTIAVGRAGSSRQADTRLWVVRIATVLALGGALLAGITRSILTSGDRTDWTAQEATEVASFGD